VRIEGYIGEPGNTAETVASVLSIAGGAPVELVINSPGGDAFEGAAIFAELRNYPGRVTAAVRGIAASAASLVAMGADDIVMDAAAVMMIHDPSALTIGPARAHRQSAEMLDKLGGVYAAAYAGRSGNRLADVVAWMEAETWLTAEEAVALGFADRVSEPPTKPQAVAVFDYSKFSRAPAELVALARAKGWADLPSEFERRA
jgi:ATP-dependent protease ClpP protease subunit